MSASAKLQYAAAGGVALSLQNRKTFERRKTFSYKFIPVKFAERTGAVVGFRQRCESARKRSKSSIRGTKTNIENIFI